MLRSTFRTLVASLLRPMSRSRRRSQPKRRPRFVKPCLEAFEDRIVPNAVTWINSGGGDWNTAANWFDSTTSTNHVPGATDSAIINTSGITVTHSTSATNAVQSITSQANLTLSAGTLNVSGNVQVSGTFDLAGGTLANGDVVSGTTLTGTASGGTLNGVRLDGNLDLASNNNAILHLVNGLTLNGTASVGNTAGTTTGTIDLDNTQTIGGSGHILFGGSTNNGLRVPAGGPRALVTFGPNLLVDGKNGVMGGYVGTFGLGFINQGTIKDDVAGGNLIIQFAGGINGVNSGTLQALNGGSITVTPQSDNTSWINTGTVQVSAGSTMIVNGHWTNNGLFQVLSGGTLSTTTTPTNFSSGTLTGGTWRVSGNSILRVALPSGITTNAATILLDGAGSNFYRDSGTTDALAATFALNAAAGSFTVQNGYNFTTANNATTGGNFENDGTLAVGASSTFTVAGSLANYDGVSTLTGGTYQIGGTFQFTGANIQTNAANIVLSGPTAQITDLNGNDALGPNLTLNAAGASLTIQNGYNFSTAGAFENDGTLTVGNNSTFTVNGTDTDTGTLSVLAGGTLSLPGGGTASGTVSNAGTVVVVAGNTFSDSGSYSQSGTLQVQSGATATLSGTFSNYDGVSTLTGGTYDLLGVLQFANAVVSTNAANLILDGSGAQVTDLNGTDALGPNLSLNAAGGHLTVLNGYSFTTAGAFENDGILTVGAGSAFNVGGNFTQGSSSTLEIQLGGVPSSSSFGQMTVSGTATFAGTLTATLVNGYVPTTGDTFPIVTYVSRSGDFTTGPAQFNRVYDDVDGILKLVAR